MTSSVCSILHPIVKATTPPPRDAILYLPPGPLSLPTKRRVASGQHEKDSACLSRDETLSSPQHILASETLSTVITVNYRLGRIGATSTRKQDEETDKEIRHFTFPTPVHDTLTGFDWIFSHIKPRRLCVYGTYVGGSLALMLGLTEPQSVHGIVAEEPVCDWTGLDAYCLPPPEDGDDGTTTASSGKEQTTKKKTGRKAKKESKSSYPDLVPLLEARRQFFRKPQNYFDSFASPALFVRSAGKDCPSEFPTYRSGPDYPVPVLEKSLEEELDMDGGLGVPTKPVRRRKAISRWPPFGLDYQVTGERQAMSGANASRTVDITLPWVRLFVQSNKVEPGQNNRSTASKASEIADGLENLNLDDLAAPKLKGGPSRNRRSPTKAGLKEASVLASQGVEMVSLLHAACFFGREKGFGEERVKLVRVPIKDVGENSTQAPESAAAPEDPVARQAGEWFCDILHAEEEG